MVSYPNFRSESNHTTEGEIEEMFPNWNMEIRECEFLSFDVWFEQRRLRLNSEASRMVHYMMKN